MEEKNEVFGELGINVFPKESYNPNGVMIAKHPDNFSLESNTFNMMSLRTSNQNNDAEIGNISNFKNRDKKESNS